MTFMKNNGDFAGPDDLTMLQEVFDELCAREQVARPSEAADALARHVIRLFEMGVRDRDGFLAAQP